MLRNLYTNNIYSGLHLSCVNVMYFTCLENILCATYLNAAYGLQENEESKNSIYRENAEDSFFQEHIKCTPYLVNKICGTHLLRVNALDLINLEKMLLKLSLINICS